MTAAVTMVTVPQSGQAGHGAGTTPGLWFSVPIVSSWDILQLGRDDCGVLSLCITQLIITSSCCSLQSCSDCFPYFSSNHIKHRSSTQIPSSIVSHYLLGLTKANTFSLHCLPSSHSSPSPSCPFFSAAPSLLAQSLSQAVFYRLIYHAAAIICRVAFHCIIPGLDTFISSPVTAQKAPLNRWLVSQEAY